MMKYIWLLIGILISIYLITQSIPNRKFGYETFPEPIIDEYTYIWQALSLREHGVPMAWTINRGVYDDSKLGSQGGDVEGFGITIDSRIIDYENLIQNRRPVFGITQIDYGKGLEHMLFVAPFFDHPPLGGIMFSAGMTESPTVVRDVHPGDFRKAPIIISIIVSVLLFLLVYLLTRNPWISTLSVAIYSTVPTYVLATRTAFLENAIVPFALAHIIFLFLSVKSIERDRKAYLQYLLLAVSGLMAGLAVLAKEPGISFVLSGIYLLAVNKVSVKKMMIFAGFVALPIVIYAGWGMWLLPELFKNVFLTNAGRGYFGAIKPVTMLEALKFKNFPVDGWWIFGIFSYLYISLKPSSKKNTIFITAPLTFCILTVLLLGSPNYSWYWLTTIPFFAIASALTIWSVYEKPNWVNSLLFFLIPFSSSYYWGRLALGVEQSISHYRYSMLVFVALLFLRMKFSKSTIVKIIWFIFLAYLIKKIVIFNWLFFPYMIAHWGDLPVPSLPNF